MYHTINLLPILTLVIVGGRGGYGGGFGGGRGGGGYGGGGYSGGRGGKLSAVVLNKFY